MIEAGKQVFMKRSLMSLALLLVTIGCGEDYSAGRRKLIDRDTPGLGGEDEPLLVASQLHRSRPNPVFSTMTEIDLIVSGNLNAGYRTIPSMFTDDEGKNGANVRTKTSLGRPTVNCGMNAGLSVTQRIQDCANLNVDRASWIGRANGASGESTWSLVALSENQEVWLDTRTGLLWSDLQTATNWCKASGNTQSGNTVNCATMATSEPCISSVALKNITEDWRLPTRNDYLQADLDGLRFVMKEAPTGFWTATVDSQSEDRSVAWVYVQTQGTLEKASMTQDRNVRCVGAAAF